MLLFHRGGFFHTYPDIPSRISFSPNSPNSRGLQKVRIHRPVCKNLIQFTNIKEEYKENRIKDNFNLLFMM